VINNWPGTETTETVAEELEATLPMKLVTSDALGHQLIYSVPDLVQCHTYLPNNEETSTWRK
jgi:hypothetical protein